jgi:transcriptional regulator with XRE-family HTH domain
MTKSNRKRSTADDKVIGANLRHIRISRGMTQEALAHELGLTFQQVQKYEKGVNAIASSRVSALCRILRIVPSDLFDGLLGNAKPEPVEPMSAGAARMASRINTLSPAAHKIMAAVLDAVGDLWANRTSGSRSSATLGPLIIDDSIGQQSEGRMIGLLRPEGATQW